jgi:2-dehydropantoate 2-reductase
VRLLVVGAGAVGGVLGARLLRAGQEVTLVARGSHAEAMRRQGLKIEGETVGTFWPNVVSSIPSSPTPDAIFVTVKTFDLAAAGTMLGQQVAPPVPVLALQNGLEIEVTLVSALRAAGWTQPEHWVVRGVNSVPSMRIGPGELRHAGKGEILLPNPSRGGAAIHSSLFQKVLEEAGIPVRLVESIDREEWRKALLNAAINPVTAVHRVPNGELLKEPESSEARGLLREAQRAAHLAGFDFTDAEADEDLLRVLHATATNRSSMVQDLELGRPTEIDAISGAILRTAEAHGVKLPATERMVGLIRQMTATPLPLSRSPPSGPQHGEPPRATGESETNRAR